MKTPGLIAALIAMLLPFTTFSQTGSVITGAVTGSDGVPMAMANVQIVGPLDVGEQSQLFSGAAYLTAQANASGEFRIVTDLVGPFYLVFMGIDHQKLTVPVVLTGHDSLRMNVRVATCTYPSHFQSIQVVYDRDQVEKGRQALMTPESDGTYDVKIPTGRSKITYSILSFGGSLFGVTTAASYDSFQLGNDGFYSACVKSNGGYAEIKFDPSKLPRYSGHAEINFTDTNLVQSRFIRHYEEFQAIKKEYNESFKNHFACGGTYSDFVYDPGPTLLELGKEIEAADAPLLKQQLCLEYLGIAELSTVGFDTATFRSIVNRVPPGSRVWVYYGSLPLQVASAMPDSAKFITDILSNSLMREYAASLLFRLCIYAGQSRDQNMATNIYDRLVNDYHETIPAKVAERMLWPAARRHVVGSVPDYAFQSVDDTNLVYTSSTFRGKYVLLDFWATWCGPCVEEMKYLREAYEKFHGSGLEILSISFDQSLEFVRTFEKTKYRIPWASAYVPRINSRM